MNTLFSTNALVIFLLLFALLGASILLFLTFQKYSQFAQKFHKTKKEVLMNRIKKIFLFSSLLFLCIALLKPQWGQQEMVSEAKGIDMVFTLDVSQSMRAEDFSQGNTAVNRLDMAKKMITTFVKKNPENRFSLVVFAGESFTIAPLTFDHETFLTFLQDTHFDDIQKQGTNLTEAISVSLERFPIPEEGEEPRSKMVILITDGEEQTGGVEAGAKSAKEESVPIVTVGIGSEEGNLIPVGRDVFGNPQYKKYKGELVRTRLNEEPLITIANITEGEYYHPTTEKEFLEIEEETKSLQKSVMSHTSNGQKEDQYQIFVGLAFLLFLLGMFLPNVLPLSGGGRGGSMQDRSLFKRTKGNRGILGFTLLFPLFFTGCSFSDLPSAVHSSSAKTLYEEGDFSAAQEKYERIAEISEEKKYFANAHLGKIAYEKGNYEKAQDYFQKALDECPEESAVCTETHYDVGNTLYKKGEQTSDLEEKKNLWQESLSEYESYLRKRKDDTEAWDNLRFVQQKLKKLEEQEEKEDGEKKSGSDQKDNEKQNAQEEDKKNDEKTTSEENAQNGGSESSDEEKLTEDAVKQVEQYMQRLQDIEEKNQQFFQKRGEEEQNSNTPFDDPFFDQFFREMGDQNFRDDLNGDTETKDW